MADQRWRDRPRAMSPAVVEAAAGRIAEHARAHGLASVDVVLHGGEPLLAGPTALAHCVAAVRTACGPSVQVRVALQTNATRLTPLYLDLFGELDVRVSVSLDGDQAAHDRHRRRADGRGSYGQVSLALDLLSQEPYRRLFGGLLCTVDLRNDPVASYQELLRYRPPAIDFLLPHGNWATPPPGLDPDSTATPYAAWLITVFDRWYHAPRRETRVRRFEETISVLLGGDSLVEGVGLAPTVHTVVETDGSIEQSDMLTSAYEGAAVTGLHVATDSFDDVLRLPSVALRQQGLAALNATCQRCPVVGVCGGGLLPHRYRPGSDFANPSVYCRDQLVLIGHVRTAIANDVAALRRARQ